MKHDKIKIPIGAVQDEKTKKSRFKIKKKSRKNKNRKLLLSIVFLFLIFFIQFISKDGTTGNIEETKDLDVEFNKNVYDWKKGSTEFVNDHEQVEINNQKDSLPASVGDLQDIKEEGIEQHIIQSGDNLYQLSMKYYGNSKYETQIAEYNNLTNQVLNIGEVIHIPYPPPEEWDHSKKENEKVVYHEVESGDTLYSISVRYYQSAEFEKELADYNQVNEPSDLKVGDMLIIPKLN